MKTYFYYGDYYDDGHGHYERVLVDIPSEEQVYEAIQKVRDTYNCERIFDGFGNEYNQPFLSETAWKAMIDADYPIERLADYSEEDGDIHSFKELHSHYPDYDFEIEDIIDMHIWLLNKFGAGITQLGPDEEFPSFVFMMGYGCWY